MKIGTFSRRYLLYIIIVNSSFVNNGQICNKFNGYKYVILTPAIAKTAIVNPKRILTESCLSLFLESQTPQQTKTNIREMKNSTKNPWNGVIKGLTAGEHTPVFPSGSKNELGVAAYKKNKLFYYIP